MLGLSQRRGNQSRFALQREYRQIRREGDAITVLGLVMLSIGSVSRFVEPGFVNNDSQRSQQTYHSSDNRQMIGGLGELDVPVRGDGPVLIQQPLHEGESLLDARREVNLRNAFFSEYPHVSKN